MNNSVLLTAKHKRIAVSGLGNNIQPKDNEEVTLPHQFSCDCCDVTPDKIGEVRYICLGCRSDPNY